MEELNVPTAVRPYADRVVAMTDAVCLEHLDVEYANLCRRVVGKLGRKRPSPLEVVQDLRLSDLVFPPDSAAAWIHAAYRRCLGLRAHPTAMPAGWKPSWL